MVRRGTDGRDLSGGCRVAARTADAAVPTTGDARAAPRVPAGSTAAARLDQCGAVVSGNAAAGGGPRHASRVIRRDHVRSRGPDIVYSDGFGACVVHHGDEGRGGDVELRAG